MLLVARGNECPPYLETGCVRRLIEGQKKTRGKPRVHSLYCRNNNYQLSFSVYLPLVEPVPPL